MNQPLILHSIVIKELLNEQLTNTSVTDLLEVSHIKAIQTMRHTVINSTINVVDSTGNSHIQ